MTPDEARRALAAIRPDVVGAAVKAALRAGAGRIKRRAVKDFLASGIGRGVYVRDASGGKRTATAKGKRNALKLLTVSRVELSGVTAKATATARGLAALSEVGGQIGPHKIAPSGPRPLLSFGPGEVATGSVQHPGASVPRRAAMAPALTVEDPKIAADITRRLDLLVVKHLG